VLNKVKFHAINFFKVFPIIYLSMYYRALEGARGGAVATNRTVAFSIPYGVIGPGVDSRSNRSGHQEYFMGVKAAGA
jgi:hypothetical protein